MLNLGCCLILAANDAGATEDTKKDNETPTASEKQYDGKFNVSLLM